ncbi:hypothetical protein SUSAZ_01820 [Sulfolobus acidocaldarius SUSAZ]|nr:hypothetical protein SUSAZ_01820 [Sulfolobus acidocaldarius SUSAZ]
MFYELMLYIHLLGIIGWAGLSTGAYYLIEFMKLTDSSILVAYRKLVFIEIISLFVTALSGAYMWMELGFPRWAYYAFIISPFILFLEFYHYRLTYRGVVEFRRRMRFVSVLYILVTLFLFYVMIFKPEFFHV